MITRQTVRATLRVVSDFAMGIALFAVAVSCLALGHEPAFAGQTLLTPTLLTQGDSGTWLTTVVHVSTPRPATWTPSNRDAALLLLAVTSGTITAFNMAIARQLRNVAIYTRPSETV